LRHDRVKVARSGSKGDVQVSIFGKEGIVIRRGADAGAKQQSGSEPTPAEVQPGATAPAGNATPVPTPVDADDDDFPVKNITQQIFTVPGLIGDLGTALLIIVFAYLVASKIVVRKVAQADEKVRYAVDAAERETVGRQLVQAKLQVLQAQVEPHFLFNTLAAVDYLIETDPPRASQMQKALITYLRGALPQMREESSTLGRELRLIRSYLDLIKMRIEDRLEVEFAVPEGVDSAEFPPMMLQSLVENAIKHGIEPKPEGGKVTVAARIQDGQLWVEVRDTGVGLTGSVDKLVAPASDSGIGLQNIRERLAMLYPGKGRLILISDERTGTVVRIVIPYRVGKEAQVQAESAPQLGESAA
jgi:signal transduction histidine kinase